MVCTLTQRRVLVLDAGLQPVSIVTAKRAFVLLADRDRPSKPHVLRYSDDGLVVGSEMKLRLPSVIQLLGRMVPRYKQRVRFCRKNVLVGRDRCICQYCGVQGTTERLTLDHVLPRAQGGQTTWENVVACCFVCNQRKANRTPEQARMKLRKKPVRPHQLLDVTIDMGTEQRPAEWKDYWDVTLLP